MLKNRRRPVYNAASQRVSWITKLKQHKRWLKASVICRTQLKCKCMFWSFLKLHGTAAVWFGLCDRRCASPPMTSRRRPEVGCRFVSWSHGPRRMLRRRRRQAQIGEIGGVDAELLGLAWRFNARLSIVRRVRVTLPDRPPQSNSPVKTPPKISSPITKPRQTPIHLT